MSVQVLCVRPVEQVVVVEPVGAYPAEYRQLTKDGRELNKFLQDPHGYKRQGLQQRETSAGGLESFLGLRPLGTLH